MKKKLYWNITISIVLVAVFIFVVSSFSANFIKSKEVDTRVLASSDVDITTSIQNQSQKIIIPMQLSIMNVDLTIHGNFKKKQIKTYPLKIAYI